MKRAEHHSPPLVVLRSETETGHVGLRLVGELDLSTVDVLEAALARARDEAPPSIIDLSELRFLDLIGLRALLRAVEDEVGGLARLVGATGIVRRLIELAHRIEAPPDVTAGAGVPAAPAVAAAWDDARAEWADAPGMRTRRPAAACSSPPRDEERA